MRSDSTSHSGRDRVWSVPVGILSSDRSSEFVEKVRKFSPPFLEFTYTMVTVDTLVEKR